MTSVNGPPIRMRIENLDNGWRLRSSYGEVMRRHDIHDGTGWRDFAWEDLPEKTLWELYDSKGKVVLADRGKSQWSNNGPAVPAERGCTECHKSIGNALPSDPLFRDAALLSLVALHWPKGDKPKPAPVPVPMPERGPPGIPGAPGAPGAPGKDADVKPLLDKIAALEARLAALEGKPSGLTLQDVQLLMLANMDKLKGKDGVNGEDGKVNVIVKWEDGKVIGKQSGAASGGTVTVYLNKREVARKLAAEGVK